MTKLAAATGRDPFGANNHRDFIVGQDQDGHGLAVETHGLGGGLFTDRYAAIHHAAFSNGCCRESIKVVMEKLRLRS